MQKRNIAVKTKKVGLLRDVIKPMGIKLVQIRVRDAKQKKEKDAHDRAIADAVAKAVPPPRPKAPGMFARVAGAFV